MSLARTTPPLSRVAFVLAVAALMVAFWMAYLMLHTAVLIVRMSAWPTVPATLDEVELHHPGSATARSLSVGARYHYVIDGHTVPARKGLRPLRAWSHAKAGLPRVRQRLIKTTGKLAWANGYRRVQRGAAA